MEQEECVIKGKGKGEMESFLFFWVLLENDVMYRKVFWWEENHIRVWEIENTRGTLVPLCWGFS